jgi:hypothetical protein
MLNVALYLANALDASTKPQNQIAKEAGFPKSNVLSMMKSGQTKIPLERIRPLAEAAGLDPKELLRRCLMEYHPNMWQMIVDIFESKLSISEGDCTSSLVWHHDVQRTSERA